MILGCEKIRNFRGNEVEIKKKYLKFFFLNLDIFT